MAVSKYRVKVIKVEVVLEDILRSY